MEGDDLWKSITTADETWIYCYDLEMKIQSTEWVEKGQPRANKARTQKSVNKIMVDTLFDYKGML